MITPQEAKELTLEVWRYLMDHPEISKKKYLPDELRKKIECCRSDCPLCELFYDKFRRYINCIQCPLKSCLLSDTAYEQWRLSVDPQTRQQAAAKIVALIEAWEPESMQGEKQ